MFMLLLLLFFCRSFHFPLSRSVLCCYTIVTFTLTKITHTAFITLGFFFFFVKLQRECIKNTIEYSGPTHILNKSCWNIIVFINTHRLHTPCYTNVINDLTNKLHYFENIPLCVFNVKFNLNLRFVRNKN